MKAKLIKTEGSYILKDGLLQVIGVDDKNLKERLNCNYLLSTKNCQAIELGYDLDELISEADTSHLARWASDSHELMFDEGFKIGFQKALELMGDKKFTEEDMFKMFIYGNSLKMAIERNAIENKPMGDIFNDFIQSLQQTEWDVEIEMEVVPDFYSRSDQDGSIFTSNKKEIPKLDADGCLILKRI